jgi:16S rRNA processing protein RimM
MQRIAQVLKSNGKDGELVMSFVAVDPDEIDLKEPVYIEDDGLPVPYFFESFQRRGNTKALVRLTGVRSLEDAEELAGRPVYADDGVYEEEEESFDGWELQDQDGRTVGRIAGCEDIPGNLCLAVETPSGNEVLVPFHEDLLIEADADSRILRLTIPEGLI